jgi:hypothetical protein
MGKQARQVCFKLFSRRLLGRTKECYRNISYDSLLDCKRSNLEQFRCPNSESQWSVRQIVNSALIAQRARGFKENEESPRSI